MLKWRQHSCAHGKDIVACNVAKDARVRAQQCLPQCLDVEIARHHQQRVPTYPRHPSRKYRGHYEPTLWTLQNFRAGSTRAVPNNAKPLCRSLASVRFDPEATLRFRLPHSVDRRDGPGSVGLLTLRSPAETSIRRISPRSCEAADCQ